MTALDFIDSAEGTLSQFGDWKKIFEFSMSGLEGHRMNKMIRQGKERVIFMIEGKINIKV